MQCIAPHHVAIKFFSLDLLVNPLTEDVRKVKESILWYINTGRA